MHGYVMSLTHAWAPCCSSPASPAAAAGRADQGQGAGQPRGLAGLPDRGVGAQAAGERAAQPGAPAACCARRPACWGLLGACWGPAGGPQAYPSSRILLAAVQRSRLEREAVDVAAVLEEAERRQRLAAEYDEYEEAGRAWDASQAAR